MSVKRRADALLQQCYADYRIKLFNYCLSRLNGSREAADDCVQEAFIVFYKKLIEGEEFENPRAFLYRTADNFVKRQKQRLAEDLRHSVPLDDARDFESPDIDRVRLQENIDYGECAKRLIKQLGENEKQLYIMRYQQKMSVESISSALGISRPAASMRLIRLRNRVEEMIYGSSFEEKGG
ncbi:MAG: sigma-70 family RNA polymerase sigma factor [Clostridia bacterium]|nr:sigma-70 family RNA polymerase sigma factor [Clostridia bacterium]